MEIVTVAFNHVPRTVRCKVCVCVCVCGVCVCVCVCVVCVCDVPAQFKLRTYCRSDKYLARNVPVNLEKRVQICLTIFK
jgi:hypothetical protein